MWCCFRSFVDPSQVKLKQSYIPARPPRIKPGLAAEVNLLKLKKVQILGFKSFCDRTEDQLSGEGIAAIVGPNGCGQSNISDPITWVLVEQSANSPPGIKTAV